MSTTLSHDKFARKCCAGFRLNARRLSVRRLRTNFLSIFRRWRKSYRNALRLITTCRNSSFRHPPPAAANFAGNHQFGYLRNNQTRSMRHSNSFCSEAIADCLEFIKRNSVSVDDDVTKPMLGTG